MYYRALLSSPPTSVEPGLTSARYKTLIQQGASGYTDADVAIPSLDVLPPLPTPPVVVPPDRPIIQGPSDDEGMPPIAPPTPPVNEPSSSDEERLRDLTTEPDSDVEADCWPETIMGQPVALKENTTRGGRIKGMGLLVKCCNSDHQDCSKFRSIHLDVTVFGRRAAEYFLGAWLVKGHTVDTTDAHKNPNRQEVREYMELVGAVLD